MSDLTIFVGKGKRGTITFSEPGAPADGAVQSSDPATATISLDPNDLATWTVMGVAVSTTDVMFTYTGTSDAPDQGPVQIDPMTATIVAVPPAETGSFNPTLATDI